LFNIKSYDGGELVSKIRDKSYCSEEDVRIIISRLADAVGLFLIFYSFYLFIYLFIIIFIFINHYIYLIINISYEL